MRRDLVRLELDRAPLSPLEEEVDPAHPMPRARNPTDNAGVRPSFKRFDVRPDEVLALFALLEFLKGNERTLE